MHIDRAAIVAARQSFLGVEFDVIDAEQALGHIQTLSRRAEFSYIITPNVDHIVRLSEESPHRSRFQEAYCSADKIVCDSRILATIAGWHSISLPIVTGSDLTSTLFNYVFKSGDRVAIIGTSKDVVEQLKSLYPHPTYIHHEPPMGLLGNDRAMAQVVAFVAAARAHFVLYAVGAPQSEIAAHLCKASGQASGVGLCIGASIEFLTGAKIRAPEWLQRLKLEWLFRMLTEPRRLASRYVVGAFKLARIYWRWRRLNPS